MAVVAPLLLLQGLKALATLQKLPRGEAARLLAHEVEREARRGLWRSRRPAGW
jgi:hypothetical protein